MMKPINQKLVSSTVSRFIGYALLSLPLTFAAKCGSLIETMDCIAQKYELKRPCKVIDTKLISTSPSQANISMATNRIYFEFENGNEEGYDPNNFTATLEVGSRPAIQIPTSALEIISTPGNTKLGRTTVGIKIDNTVFNQTDPNNPLNLGYGDVVTVIVRSGSFSTYTVYIMPENPAGLADIDNDYSIVEVVTASQIRLRNVINGDRVKTINLTGVLPVNDYVYSHIEGDKLFLLRDIGTSSRSEAGDPISNGHNVIEIDLLTGNFASTVVASENLPIFNVMESIINAHQGPTTTVTTPTPPADWRIYQITRRKNIVNGAGADLVLSMQYQGETQEIIVNTLPLPGVFSSFEGAFPVISQRLSNNTYIVMTEPGRFVKLTFDYNSAAAWGSKVTVTPTLMTLPLTIPNTLAGEYVLGHSIVEDKNTPGQFLVLYSDINGNRFVAKFDVNGNLLGRVQVPNSVVKIISFASQAPESALGFYHTGSNQVEVRSGINFGASTTGVPVYFYTGNLQLVVVPPNINNPNESAAQTADAATEIYNKSQAGVSVVNLTAQQIEKRSLNGTLIGLPIDISGFISTLKTNLGIASPLVLPNDAKVIEQAGNHLLILRINDGNERVAVLDLAASAATWISPIGMDCDMVYGAGKFNNGVSDRLLVLYHLNGDPNYRITDGLTTYTNALGTASVNTMIILDPAFTNGAPTQMKVAVGKTNGLQLLTFNKANLAAPVSDTTVLNNLIAEIGAGADNGNVLSLQAHANSDDDGATPTLYVLNQVLKDGQLKQMIFTLNTAGTVSAGFLEWTFAAKDIQGGKRLIDGRSVITDPFGRTYVMDVTGGTYRTFLNNMRRSNIYR